MKNFKYITLHIITEDSNDMIEYTKLYKQRQDGKYQGWYMVQNDDHYHSVSYICDEMGNPVKTSVVTSEPRQASPTNVGRANYRSGPDQARFIIESGIKSRLEQGYVKKIGDSPMIPEKISPMLADTFSTKTKLPKLFYSQPKLDGCLDENTLIHTDQGIFTIKDVVENNKGDSVLSYDTRKNKIVYSKILNRMKNLNDIKDENIKWLKIKTKSGKKIILTSNHRVWLPDIQAWREANYLRIGDNLLTQ